MKKIPVLLLIFLLPSAILSSPASGPDDKGVYWGAFIGGEPSVPAAKVFDGKAGKKMAQVMWFIDWNSDFPSVACTELYKAGYIPHITWEPWLWSEPSRTSVNLDKILAGQFDGYITVFAKAAKACGVPILLRMAHEFNGDWYPWCISKNGNDPEKYKKAWAHIHDIFVTFGADNVQWVWCPNAASSPNYTWNDPAAAYPGDEFVDWIAIDGYNFGTSQSWSSWTSFEDIFRPMYHRLTVKFPSKPMMIGEFACSDKGGDKAAWIAGLEAGLKKFPAVRAITWFDMNKETDWRITSSPEVLESFRKAISSKYFLSSPKGLEGVLLKHSVSMLDPGASRLSGKAASPPPKKHPLVIIKTVQDAVVDGILNEKIKTEPLTIGDKNGPLSAKIYLGFDSTSLYLFADVTDPNPGANDKKGKDIWNGDCLELAISTDANADPERPAFADHDFQAGIKASEETQTWNWTTQAPIANPVIFYKKREGGYIIEAFIPWYNFNTGCLCHIKNKAISFDMAIDEAGADGNRKTQARWAGSENYYKDPSEWGRAIFSTEP